MKTLSISVAWNEAAAFVRREGSLLFPVAFALIALPSILFQATAPVPVPGEQSEPGLWAFFFLPMLLITLLGTLTLTIMALHPGTVVRDAIGAAARRVLPVFGAIFLFGFAVALILTPLVVMTGASEAGAPSGTAVLLLLVTLPLLFFVCVRLMLLNAVGANEAIGPIAMLRRSWALTSGHFWKLLGFLVVISIVVVVVAVAVNAIGGILVTLTAGRPEPGSLSTLLILILGGLLNAVVSVFATAAIARIYAQLA